MNKEHIKQTLEEAKQWHQGDGWRYGSPEEQAQWTAHMAKLDAAIVAISQAEPVAERQEAQPKPDVTEMVNRFLGWKLPHDFYPDAGISFDRSYAEKWGMPIGTNLLTADQARAMFEYCCAAPSDAQPQEQPKPANLIATKWVLQFLPDGRYVSDGNGVVIYRSEEDAWIRVNPVRPNEYKACKVHVHSAPSDAQPQEQPEDISCDQCIELAEELVWATVRKVISETKDVSSRMHEGPFQAGMDTACEGIETRLNLAAAPVTVQPASKPDVIEQEQYLIIGYGETDVPQVEFADTKDAAFERVIGMIYSPASEMPEDERDGIAAKWNDADEWFDMDGTRWTITFEIGGIEVTRIPLCRCATSKEAQS